MIHPIVIDGDPVLRQRAAEVTEFDDALVQLVADMYDTMRVSNGVGLAAPQIGVGQRIFVFDAPDEDEQRRGVVVNPSLMIVQRPPRFALKGEGKRPPKSLTDVEGCLSFPGPDFEVKRHYAVRVTGWDEHGEPVVIDGEGWFARVLQHEYDHLDGLLYVDRLKGRDKAEARAISQENGWGVPGLSWMPGVDPDPFGHDVPDGDGDVQETDSASDE